MKKIGIDARLYGQTGVGVYIRNFLYVLSKNLPAEWIVYIYLMNEDFENATFSNKNFIKRRANFHWHGVGEQTSFLNVLNKDQLDLMHFTYFSYPIGYKNPFISTIHDLTPLLFHTGKASTKNKLVYNIKRLFLKKVFRSQTQNAKYIITPTLTVKQQLANYYGKQYENKIVPIYEGINRDLKITKENSQLSNRFNGRFFIYVGNFYPHKNIELLIEAFAKIKTDDRLVLIGPDDFFTGRIFQLINKLMCQTKIILFKNPTLKDLVFFYKHAVALIHPSLAEGFGLTLIEAAYFDCPIIASNIPVIKEILGESYIGFDPNNVSDIEEKITNFLENPKKFNSKKIVNAYSFEKMTQETVNVYKKVLSS